MSQTVTSRAADNPFAARNLRPGAIPYLFPQQASCDSFVEKLRANGWWGEIVGPHGSGKSTLIATLLPAITDRGLQSSVINLHDGQRRLPADWLRRSLRDGARIVVVDGYEQLSRFNRWQLKQYCAWHGLGLLVASHAATGLPRLMQTRTDEALARQVVALLSNHASWRPSDHEISRVFKQQQGNLREVLFALYDLYEQCGR